MRIYTDLPDQIIDRIEQYKDKKPYKMTRNAAIIELIDIALKEKGF